ncbi:MAG: TonB-dependent receptor [Steroidobacteraceae bacterium]
MSGVRSDGTNACEGYGAPRYVGCFTDEPDRDGYRNRSGSLHAGVTLGEATRLDATLLEARGRVNYDGSFANEAEFLQRTAGLSLRQPLARGWSLQAQLGQARDDSENFLGAESRGRFDTRRDSASLLLGGPLAQHLELTAGLDLLRDSVDSDAGYLEDARTARGAYAELHWSAGRADLLASLRRDDNQQFGGRTTGSLALGVALAPGWRWTLSGGTGFKAPTFNELYFPGFGNPALGPETSASVETSLRWTRGASRATLTAFQNRIDDLIGFDSNFQPVNIDRTRTRGLELEFATSLAGWDVALAGQLYDPRNLGGELRGRLLPRRAPAGAPRRRTRVPRGAAPRRRARARRCALRRPRQPPAPRRLRDARPAGRVARECGAARAGEARQRARSRLRERSVLPAARPAGVPLAALVAAAAIGPVRGACSPGAEAACPQQRSGSGCTSPRSRCRCSRCPRRERRRPPAGTSRSRSATPGSRCSACSSR